MATSFDYRVQARTYDTTRAASPSVLDPLRRALSSTPGLVVDVGGGTGNYAAALSAEGWQPIVVDRSVDMLSVAAGKEGVIPCLGDAAALPLPDACADAVLLISMLHHVPDWAVALHEACRITRPHGVVAVVAFTREQLDVHGLESYFPDTLAHFAEGHQTRAELVATLPGATVTPVFYTDVVDGSLAALARHPELFLDPEFRRQTSFVEWAATHRPDELADGLEQLAADLAAGEQPQDRNADRRAEIGDVALLTATVGS